MKKYILILISIIYLVSPIDIIPDFLLPFGIADDFIVLLFLIREITVVVKSKRNIPSSAKFPFENPDIIEGEIIK